MSVKSYFEKLTQSFSSANQTINLLKDAAEKYNAQNNDAYNFLDINNNIRMLEELIKSEDARLIGKRRQSAIVLTAFGLLFVYFPQIITFVIGGHAQWWFYLAFVPYLLLLLAAVVSFILYIWPKDIPQLQSPTHFYTNLLDQYRNEDGLDDEQSNIGVKHSYRKYLDDNLDKLQKVNAWKGQWHYRTIVCMALCFVFYLASSAIVMGVNGADKNKSKTIKIQNKMEEKKKFDPSKTREVPTKVVKEGLEVKFVNKQPTKTDSTGK